jgi:hypothetical protein
LISQTAGVGYNKLSAPISTLVTADPGGLSMIAKTEKDDEEKELELELAYQQILTNQQRFELMFRKSREIAETLLRHGY